MKYPHLEIEKKWQAYWEEKKIFKVKKDLSKPKYYILDMFPYPSGSGLHVGHVTGYTATDILARYKRHLGFNVLHPMGWDSFGLQAEQYAIRTGTHPKDTTRVNINTYRKQLQSLGFSYDWDREVTTSDPSYYKWTQWIFTKLYERGLAYQAAILVNYCPDLGTVLANEEIENGRAKEGGYPIERRPLRQWVLKITDYADRLLQDLDLLDWPDYLKTLQRNWIGKSEGAKIIFIDARTKLEIPVFTTCPETLFAATFLVVSPEHPQLSELVVSAQKDAVKDYLKATAKKSDFERTELAQEKTGVWTGSYAQSPVSEALIPIWVADYVLMGYGTGAVMGVPGGDERDFAFAKKYDLPVIAPYEPLLESIPDGVPPEVFYSEMLDGKRCAPEGKVVINGKGPTLNLNGLAIKEARKSVIDYLEKHQVGKGCVTYKLRDWLFSRQRYWGEPIPILHFEDGKARPLELDELPLTLPALPEYRPPGEGKAPLDQVTSWVHLIDPKTGKKVKRETNTMPQWAGSCWYYLRFCDPSNSSEAWSKEEEKYWMPVDLYVGGVEHAVLHLLYARFWHKVFYDCGYVSTLEPFQKLRNQGLVTAKAFKKPEGGYVDPEKAKQSTGLIEMVEKMSKSKLNGVSPDAIIEAYGADSLRLYEMFMGPFDKEKLWKSEAISGCRRFLDRFYGLVFSNRVVEEESLEGVRLAHKLVDGVQRDIEGMLFNTAISKMMEFVNAFSRLPSYPKKALEMATLVLSPFAPHLAEECWRHLGHTESIAFVSFPTVDDRYLAEETVTYVIQVNGKFRSKWELPKGQTKQSLIEKGRDDPKVSRFFSQDIAKVVFVPNKLLNLVLKGS